LSVILNSKNIIGIDNNVLTQYLKRIHKKALKSGIDRDIWQENYKALLKGIEDGWGSPFAEINYNHPNWKYIAELKYHTASFAAFKNHDEVNEITKLLIGEDGKPRKWIDFRNEALKVSEKYNKRWLQTEFNHAHQSARMAAKWKEYETTADLYPNLRYVAVMDDRTRPEHKKLHGLIYPMNHSFWDVHYPPNDYGCRCNAMPSDDPVNMSESLPDLPPGFRNNPGKTGKVFDTKGGYYKGVGAKSRSEIDKLTQNYYRWGERKTAQEWGVANLINHAGIMKRNAGQVTFTTKGIKEFLNQPHEFYNVKNQLIYQIDDILKNSTYHGRLPDWKNNSNVLEHVYYKTMIEGKASYLDVRVMKNGDKHLYSILDKDPLIKSKKNK
jgi:SPP1 gp7 family putative phage head morphogenesis protein